MNSHNHSSKQQTDTFSTNTSQEEQISDTASGLGSFHAIQKAIKKPSKATLTPSVVLQLQRTIGNRAFTTMFGENRSTLSQRQDVGIQRQFDGDLADKSNEELVTLLTDAGYEVDTAARNKIPLLRVGDVSYSTLDSLVEELRLQPNNQPTDMSGEDSTGQSEPSNEIIEIVSIEDKQEITYLKNTVINQLPEQFQTEKTIISIEDMFDNLAITTDVANKLVEQVLRNANKVLAQVEQDWEAIQSNFGLKGTVNAIQIDFTGSDLHSGGQQVMIITDKKGNKVVYKPRSTSPDMNLIGSKNSVISQFNKWNKGSLFSKSGVQIPTMKFLEVDDDMLENMHSYVEFQHQSKEKTNTHSHSHFRQMGALAVIAKLTGTEDLHYDNIMSIQKGATIIDAETTFLPHVMKSMQGYASTFLQEAITKSDTESTSYFKNTKKPHLTSDFNYPSYRQAFLDGAQEILQLIQSKHEEIIELIATKMQNTSHNRLVPFPTQDFDGYMLNFREHKKNNNNEAANTVLDKVTNLVIDNLRVKGFEIYGEVDMIREFIKVDFENGDIPIFHYENHPNQVIYRGENIGSFPRMDNLNEFVGEVVDNMLERGLEGIRKDFYLDEY